MNFSSRFEYKNTKVLTYFNEAASHRTTCQGVTACRADVSTFVFKLLRFAYRIIIRSVRGEMKCEAHPPPCNMEDGLSSSLTVTRSDGKAVQARSQTVRRRRDLSDMRVFIKLCIPARALRGPSNRGPALRSAAFTLYWLLHGTQRLWLG